MFYQFGSRIKNLCESYELKVCEPDFQSEHGLLVVYGIECKEQLTWKNRREKSNGNEQRENGDAEQSKC